MKFRKKQLQAGISAADELVMLGPANPSRRSRSEIFLDGECLELAAGGSPTPELIRGQLETFALRKNRFLVSLEIDGTSYLLSEPLTGIKSWKRITATSIPLPQVGRHLVWLSGDQLERLREKVEREALLVMINDANYSRQSWWNLLPELKVPFMILNMVPDLLSRHPSTVQNSQLEFFIQQVILFREMLVDLDEICTAADVLEYSEGLEKKLAPWLRRMADFLKHIDVQPHE